MSEKVKSSWVRKYGQEDWEWRSSMSGMKEFLSFLWEGWSWVYLLTFFVEKNKKKKINPDP